MRIGILTLPLHTNYGGILQVYALQTVLERMGHKVIVFDMDRKPKDKHRPHTVVHIFIKRILLSFLGGYHFDYFNINTPINKPYKVFQKRTKFTSKFIKKYIHQYCVCNLAEEIKETDYDAIVVGSDQVWRDWTVPDINLFFLTFAKTWNIKKIAYAASFGSDKINYSKEKLIECIDGLQSFSYVSCRELDGVDLCRNVFNRRAEFVLDPTLLLSKNDYQQLYSNNGKIEILSYIIDRDAIAIEIEKQISEQSRKQITIINSRVEDRYATEKERNVSQPPVERFLSSFDSCEMIITDSFHACVFSIIYNKPFWVLGNKTRGLSRFISLLDLFNLRDRLIDTDGSLEVNFLKEIDWAQVNSILEIEKCKSEDFLVRALK